AGAGGRRLPERQPDPRRSADRRGVGDAGAGDRGRLDERDANGSVMTTPTRVEHEVVCRLVTHSDELDAHFSVRRAVFVTEQGVFPDSDLDARDTAPETLRVVGF